MCGLFHGACVMMRPPPTWIVTHESGMPRCGRPGAAIVRVALTVRSEVTSTPTTAAPGPAARR